MSAYAEFRHGEAALHETKKVVWFIAYKKEGEERR